MNDENKNGWLWERYALYMDLYKYYFSTSLKINAFYLAVTGSIVTYYFAHPNVSNIQFALYFPIVLSVAISLLYGFGIATIGALEHDIKIVVTRMELETRVTISALYYLWWGSIVLLIIGALSMVFLICDNS
ncbi:hypothetical protein [Oceanicoccus sp. KOV_DT_Chl]|uniref:hypothetical protein n=1 Tax=Oceanicoccus sp. KOV_DT_Chl TaxID=1904639 RepID=UPI000C7B5BBD|nr:hypothetical protein [Oceanicoccus sp. KOV_DT_Chl]